MDDVLSSTPGDSDGMDLQRVCRIIELRRQVSIVNETKASLQYRIDYGKLVDYIHFLFRILKEAMDLPSFPFTWNNVPVQPEGLHRFSDGEAVRRRVDKMIESELLSIIEIVER